MAAGAGAGVAPAPIPTPKNCMKKRFIILLLVPCLWQACAPSKATTAASATAGSSNGTAATATKSPGSLQHFTEETLLRQPGLVSAQVGISLYDPAAAAFIYNYQGDKYFIPASNTKLFSLFAGMSYLGDSLIGMRYRQTDTAMFILPSGDPTLLHPAYPDQPVIRMLIWQTSIFRTTRLAAAGPGMTIMTTICPSAAPCPYTAT
jgi:hypothetical protein